jgi:hypothetical protein
LTPEPAITGPHEGAPLNLNRIRVETALSRYPIHRLAKKGNVVIDMQHEADVKWEVTYNVKHGQPGPLAYKVDTLIVNRCIDEMGRPLPELIRIGSLSEICRALGSSDTGPNIADIKRAFMQNASAFINAKIRVRKRNGKESWDEIGYTRYSMIFTGENMPDGSLADAVYIVLNPPYRDLLNRVELRPLDYDYLRQLAPGAQRFYELVSFQVYGALASGRPRAKMLYSDYCKYAPQARYPDFEHMKKQMYKVHLPHRESGYIVKVDYQQTLDGDGSMDWEMFYTPGPKAHTEYQAFTSRQNRQQLPAMAALQSPASKSQPVQASLNLSEADNTLLAEMTRRGVAEKMARELLAKLKQGQEVMDQLEYVDYLVDKDRRGKFDNPPGLYVFYVRDNIAPPADFFSSRKKLLQEQAQQAKNAERARKAQLEIDYEEYRVEKVRRHIAALPAEEYRQLLEQQRQIAHRMFKNMTPIQIDEMAVNLINTEVKQSGRVPVISFEEFYHQRQ